MERNEVQILSIGNIIYTLSTHLHVVITQAEKSRKGQWGVPNTFPHCNLVPEIK